MGMFTETVRDGFGIDRLSLSFPLRGSVDWDRFQVVTTGPGRTSGSSTVKVDGLSVFVGALEADEANIAWGKVEMNPARLHDPDGCSLATVADTHEAAEAAFDAAAQLCEPACPPAASNVKRIDEARDFRGVSRPALFVHGLQHVRRKYARKVAVYSDAQRASAQTLMVGSGAGMARLYDQHEAYAERGAPEGSLRCEIEARSDWAAKHGMRHLQDVTEARVGELMEARWKWAAFGLEVAGMDQVIERVLRSGLSAARQQRLLGVLMLRARGFGAPMGVNQRAEYEAYIRDLGVVLSAGQLEADGDPFRARLDFETGTEVLRAA